MASFAKFPPNKETVVLVPLGLTKTAFIVGDTADERTVLGEPHPVVLVTAL
jgi:hypothetical protein